MLLSVVHIFVHTSRLLHATVIVGIYGRISALRKGQKGTLLLTRANTIRAFANSTAVECRFIFINTVLHCTGAP